MDKRFANMFSLTEDEAIALLKKPLDELGDKSERYVAASHLSNFATEQSIQALIATIEEDNPDLYHRIARRKAIESLGRLQAKTALPTIVNCLQDSDPYTVENAVWAIKDIGTDNDAILAEISNLLDRENQSYRLIIQVLAQFNYTPALEKIKSFTNSEDETIASAAIASVAKMTGDYSQIDRVIAFLSHSNVNARRLSIQDLIDVKYYSAIPQIAKTPVSLVFRLRGIKLLAASGIQESKLNLNEVKPYLEKVICDRPQDLEMVHEYDLKPTLEFLIRELYQTDFGRCYLASQTLLSEYADLAAESLIATYEAEAYRDYGAHYHVIKLLGWLQYQPAKEIILKNLNHPQPQFQKSRAAAAIALGNMGVTEAIPLLQETLKTQIFDLKYASLIALKQLGDTTINALIPSEDEWLITAIHS
jgi:bilin biosynthesis protein